MKPGLVLDRHGALAARFGERSRRIGIVASDVVIARTTSTSCIIGAGLKKWIPHTRSGRPVSIAISTTGSVDVLVARIATSLQMRSSSAEEVLLRGEILDDRLDHELALGKLAEVGDGVHAGEGGVAVGRLELALVDLLRE